MPGSPAVYTGECVYKSTVGLQTNINIHTKDVEIYVLKICMYNPYIKWVLYIYTHIES